MLIDNVVEITITHRKGEGENSVTHHIRFEVAADLFLAHREVVEHAVETGFVTLERYMRAKAAEGCADCQAAAFHARQDNSYATAPQSFHTKCERHR